MSSSSSLSSSLSSETLQTYIQLAHEQQRQIEDIAPNRDETPRKARKYSVQSDIPALTPREHVSHVELKLDDIEETTIRRMRVRGHIETHNDPSPVEKKQITSTPPTHRSVTTGDSARSVAKESFINLRSILHEPENGTTVTNRSNSHNSAESKTLSSMLQQMALDVPDEEDIQLENSLNQLKNLLRNVEQTDEKDLKRGTRTKVAGTLEAMRLKRSGEVKRHKNLQPNPQIDNWLMKKNIFPTRSSRGALRDEDHDALSGVYSTIMKHTSKHSSILYGNYLDNPKSSRSGGASSRGRSQPTTARSISPPSTGGDTTPRDHLMSTKQNAIVNFTRVVREEEEERMLMEAAEEDETLRSRIALMRSQRVAFVDDPWNNNNPAAREASTLTKTHYKLHPEEEIDLQIAESTRYSQHLQEDRAQRKRRDRAYKDSATSSQSAFDRLYASSKATRAKLDRLRKKKEHQELKNFSFSPNINKSSKAMPSSREDFLRRQQESIDKRKRLEEERQREKEEVEAKLTFSPRINLSSKKLNRKIDHLISWGQERKTKRSQQKNQKDEEEQQNYTFHPFVSDRSKKLVKKYKKRESKRVESLQAALLRGEIDSETGIVVPQSPRLNAQSPSPRTTPKTHPKSDMQLIFVESPKSLRRSLNGGNGSPAANGSGSHSKPEAASPQATTSEAAATTVPSSEMDQHSVVSLDLSSERDEWIEGKSRRESLLSDDSTLRSARLTPRSGADSRGYKRKSPSSAGIEELTVPRVT